MSSYLKNLEGQSIMQAMGALMEATYVKPVSKFSKKSKGNGKDNQPQSDDQKDGPQSENGKPGKEPGDKPGQGPEEQEQPTYPSQNSGSGKAPNAQKPQPPKDGQGDGQGTPTKKRAPNAKPYDKNNPTKPDHLERPDPDELQKKIDKILSEDKRKAEKEGNTGHGNNQGSGTGDFETPYKALGEFNDLKQAMNNIIPDADFVLTKKNATDHISNTNENVPRTVRHMTRDSESLGDDDAGAVMTYKKNAKPKVGATIIVDCSGSMYMSNKIIGVDNVVVAGMAVQSLVETFAADTEFDVIFFSSGPIPLMSGEPVEGDERRLNSYPETTDNVVVDEDGVKYTMGGYALRLGKDELEADGGLTTYISKYSGQQHGGGTQLGDSISVARRWAPNNPIIFLSDMDLSGGEDGGLNPQALRAEKTYTVNEQPYTAQFQMQDGKMWGIVIDVTGTNGFIEEDYIKEMRKQIPEEFAYFVQKPSGLLTDRMKELINKFAGQGEIEDLYMAYPMIKDAVEASCHFVPAEYMVQ